MKYTAFFIGSLLLSATAFAGHGGGHGGGGSHGGGHSSGGYGGHSSHGSFGATHASSAGRSSARGSRSLSPAARQSANMARVAPPAALSATHNVTRTGATVSEGGVSTVHPGYYGYTYEHGYPFFGYGYGYGYYNPFYYDPYFCMFSLGIGVAYTPHYNYASAPGDENAIGKEQMDGYVVYEYDTIKGLINLKGNNVFIDNIEAGKHFDYKFNLKKKGLTSICLFSDADGSMVSFSRVKGDKKMLRVVHEGKLNIYDDRYGFIYRPDDIDMRTLVVVGSDGTPVHIGSSSVRNTKLRLTEMVNKAYGIDLDPNKYTWKELLIYIDKLD